MIRQIQNCCIAHLQVQPAGGRELSDRSATTAKLPLAHGKAQILVGANQVWEESTATRGRAWSHEINLKSLSQY
jgi:hypothetical protein